MRKLDLVLVLALGTGILGLTAAGQDAKPAEPKPSAPATAEKDSKAGRAYSGMYTFLNDGEFVQVTVEDEGHVTGFISRFGDGASDKGAFLNQYFKSGKLDGSKLSFTTEIIHGVSFDFQGSVERGEGKNPGDEAYFVLKGTLVESTSDVNKKVTLHSQDVAFKLFPQQASPTVVERN